MDSTNTITRELVPTDLMARCAGALFGTRFIYVESFAFDTASSISPDYTGGLWEFYRLSNRGFYMVPAGEGTFRVECANGFEGALSADALGITVWLYAYSHLSFSPDAVFAEACATHFHRLRDFAAQHTDAAAIWRATD